MLSEEEGQNEIRIGKDFQAEVPCGCVKCLSPLEARYDNPEIFNTYFQQTVSACDVEQGGAREVRITVSSRPAVMSSGGAGKDQYFQARRHLLAEASKYAQAFTKFLRNFRPGKVKESLCMSGITMKTDKG